MEPISLILTALAMGAAGGALDALKDDAKATAKAAYTKLRGLVKQRVSGREDGELALEKYEAAPEKWKGVLEAELVDSGAADDVALVAAAKTLVELVSPQSAGTTIYNTKIEKSRGFQIGSGNTQINHP